MSNENEIFIHELILFQDYIENSFPLDFLISSIDELSVTWNKNLHKVLNDFLFQQKIKKILPFMANELIRSEDLSNIYSLSDSGLLSDLSYRLHEKILPDQPSHSNLSTLVGHIFNSQRKTELISQLDTEVILRISQMIQSELEPLIPMIKNKIMESCFILGTQILDQIFIVYKESGITTKDYLRLPEAELFNLLKIMCEQKNANFIEIDHKIIDVQKHLEELTKQITSKSVPLELNYLLQSFPKKIKRLQTLLLILNPDLDHTDSIKNLFIEIAQDQLNKKNLRVFFKENFSSILNQIVQTNSNIGEHYVTFGWKDFLSILKSSLGGGFFTSLTVFLKFLLGFFQLTGFLKAFTDSINYATSFVSIQILGWTLATKQPSTTAPYIASCLEKSPEMALKSMIAVLRTQFISVFGNLALVFPVCFGISYICLRENIILMSPDIALKYIKSFSIFGPSGIFAIFTGLLLYMSSLSSGWFQNWIEIHKLSYRLKYNTIFNQKFSIKLQKQILNFIENKSHIYIGNIILGFSLGFAPQIMNFFNIPLDVRHVTLATGTFAMALPYVTYEKINEFYPIIIGLLGIGFLNIMTSFILALITASFSKSIKLRKLFKILNLGLKTVLLKPWLLIIPEKSKTTATFDDVRRH